jgi:hypothetical protein
MPVDHFGFLLIVSSNLRACTILSYSSVLKFLSTEKSYEIFQRDDHSLLGKVQIFTESLFTWNSFRKSIWSLIKTFCIYRDHSTDYSLWDYRIIEKVSIWEIW